MDTIWIHRLELGKDSIEIDGKSDKPTTTAKPTHHKYGAYKNVLLSDEDMEKLKAEFPTDWEQRIERVSEYVASTGKTYKNYLATIRTWARKDKERNGNNGQVGGVTEQNINTTYKGGKWL